MLSARELSENFNLFIFLLPKSEKKLEGIVDCKCKIPKILVWTVQLTIYSMTRFDSITWFCDIQTVLFHNRNGKRSTKYVLLHFDFDWILAYV